MQASLQVMVEPEPCFVSKLHNCQGWCKNALCSGKSSSLGEDRSIVGSHIEADGCTREPYDRRSGFVSEGNGMIDGTEGVDPFGGGLPLGSMVRRHSINRSS